MRTGTTVVFERTRAGDSELVAPRHALPLPMLQLLLLIDGRRSHRDLRHLAPQIEVAETLEALEEQGFVSRVVMSDSAAPRTIAAIDLPLASALHPAAVSGQRSALAPSVAVLAASGNPADAVEQARERMVLALRELVGAPGDALVARLERCTAIRELRELLPATLSVLEAVGGSKAAHAFLDRAGRI